MKKVKGDKKRRNHRVGMSFTSMKKAVNTARMSSRLPRNRMPEKESLERLAWLDSRDWKYLRKATTIRPQPIMGN